MRRKRRTEEEKEQVIDYYVRSKNNTAAEIAIKFNLSKHAVNRIINSYLKKLAPDQDKQYY